MGINPGGAGAVVCPLSVVHGPWWVRFAPAGGVVAPGWGVLGSVARARLGITQRAQRHRGTERKGRWVRFAPWWLVGVRWRGLARFGRFGRGSGWRGGRGRRRRGRRVRRR